MRRRLCSIALAACAIAGSAWGKAIEDLPAPIPARVSCMLGVLRTIPHVQQPDASYLDDGALVVEYVYVTPKRETFRVRFAANALHDYQLFVAGLPGIAPEGQKLELWGTDRVSALWRKRCGVTAAVMTD